MFLVFIEDLKKRGLPINGVMYEKDSFSLCSMMNVFVA